MYEDYYGFTEKPFSLTPDPKYLYKSESHANALELLQFAVRRREGFMVITGDIGTGKTTLCRALLEQIDRNTFTALVLNPFLSEEDLLKLILQDFGVVSREDMKRGRLAGISKQELIETIYDFLLGLLPLRASAVLIIDEAQNLPMPVLEQIRILSNLETDKEKLLQVVLVGQLNLHPILKAPEMRQLDQRVSIRCELKPLTSDEVAAYVSHRVTIAGGAAAIGFQPKALELVHRMSDGIPRLINLLCDRALVAAYSARTHTVTPGMVQRAAESLQLTPSTAAATGWFRRRASVLATAAGAILSLAVAGGMVAPVVRASAKQPAIADALPALPPVPAGLTPAVAGLNDAPSAAVGLTVSDNHYSVLAASFPVKEVTRDGSPAVTMLTKVTGQLEALGFAPRLADVDLKARGEWRRVLVGEFGTLDEAMQQAKQLHQTKEFADAQPIRY